LSTAAISSLAAGRIIFLHPARSDGQEKTALAGAICFSSPIDPQVFLRALDGPALRSADSGSAILSYAGIDIDLARMKVQALGTRLHLPPIQYRLLVQMMLTPEQVVTRKALMAAVWPNHRFVEGKTLNIHMGRLRSALRAASGAQPIRCVRGSGYAIELKCSAPT
jgi:two-component system phosphate regulon response regulator PhoB